MNNIQLSASISREQIIGDVNRESWKANKTQILNISTSEETAASGTISYKDVLYDVDFTTWKVGNVRMTDKKSAFEVQTDSENEVWFQRQYEIATKQIIDALRPNVEIPTSINSNADNKLTFAFYGDTHALMGYIHHYIVDFILYEWFKLTLPNEAGAYLATSEDWKTKAINEAQSKEENSEWFERMFDTAFLHIKERLMWCMDRSITEEEEDYIYFAFPPTWKGNFKALMDYAHRFITDYILYEWFKITLPSAAAVYLESSNNWEGKIINEARSEDVTNVFFRL